MRMTIKAGILIGVLCGLWMLIMGITGWYKDPVLLYLFWVVILIQLGVLIWGMRKTAGEGRTYGGQVLAGTLMSVIAGFILFFVSLLFTSVLFPNYFAELRAMQSEILRSEGKSEAEIAMHVALAAKTQTPLLQALSGMLGTIVTGFLASLIIAFFVRSKRTNPQPTGGMQ